MLEELLISEIQATLPRLCQHADTADRIATKIEKVVRRVHALGSEYFGPDTGQHFFNRRQ